MMQLIGRFDCALLIGNLLEREAQVFIQISWEALGHSYTLFISPSAFCWVA
jgi:hypothetical protein